MPGLSIQSSEDVNADGKMNYNQLVEKVTCKHSSNANLVTGGLIHRAAPGDQQGTADPPGSV